MNAPGPVPAPYRPPFPPRPPEPVGLIKLLYLAWKEPLRIWSEWHFERPTMFGVTRFGAAITVSDPEGVRRVLLDNAANYDKGPFLRRVLGPLIAKGLLLVEDDDWKRARRTLAPLFTPARLAKTAGVMAEIAQARVAAWPRDGSAVDIDHEMTALAFDVVSATQFSNRLGGDAAAFEHAFNVFSETGARVDPLDVMNVPDFVPRLGKLRARATAKFFARRIDELVSDRRALLDGGGDAPDDLLTALLRARDVEGDGEGLSDAEVSANVLTFIIAGHETTARALSWALDLLARTPHHQDRVFEEIRDVDLADPAWMKSAPWTRAVIDETMRLYPPAPTFLRRALGPDEICGRKIPADTGVSISPYVLHRHKLLWDDPDAFRPERFLPGEREKIDRYAYLPFGGGPRVCIGAAFAVQEAMIALATALRHVRVAPLDGHAPTPTHRVTLRADIGVRLRSFARD